MTFTVSGELKTFFLHDGRKCSWQNASDKQKYNSRKMIIKYVQMHMSV